MHAIDVTRATAAGARPEAGAPMTISPAEIEAILLRLTAQRGPAKSICPSEAARELAPQWQPFMGVVRQAAIRLARQGRIEILRKGKPVEPADVRGVIRLRQPPTSRAPTSRAPTSRAPTSRAG